MTQAFNLSQLANNVNTSGQLNAAAGLYNQVPVANGGTGASTLASGAVLLGNGTSALATVPAATSGNILAANGTTWVSQAPSGGTPVVRIYTSPSPWTKPATLKAVKVTLCGGGGGGGNASPNPGTPSTAGGGGAGGAGFGWFQAPVIPGPLTVTVGTAAARTVSGNPSSFGSLITATGGGAGGSFPAATSTGGLGGTITPTSTAIGIDGGQGTSPAGPQVNTGFSAAIYAGGNTGLGLGIGGGGGPSIPGVGYGWGGGGGRTPGSPLGGSSGQGLVIVEEFY